MNRYIKSKLVILILSVINISLLIIFSRIIIPQEHTEAPETESILEEIDEMNSNLLQYYDSVLLSYNTGYRETSGNRVYDIYFQLLVNTLKSNRKKILTLTETAEIPSSAQKTAAITGLLIEYDRLADYLIQTHPTFTGSPEEYFSHKTESFRLFLLYREKLEEVQQVFISISQRSDQEKKSNAARLLNLIVLLHLTQLIFVILLFKERIKYDHSSSPEQD